MSPFPAQFESASIPPICPATRFGRSWACDCPCWVGGPAQATERPDSASRARWRFESREDTSRIADIDSRVFWITLWVTPVVWGFFTVSTFFSFNYGWMLCTLVALALSGANLYGYTRCSRAAKARVGSISASITSSVLQQGFASQFGGGGGGGAANRV